MKLPTEREIKVKFYKDYTKEYLDTLEPEVVEKIWVAYARGFCSGGHDAIERVRFLWNY